VSVYVRPATPEDFDLLLPMVEELQASEGIVRDGRLEESLRTLLASPDVGRAFIVVSDDETAGYAIVSYSYDLEYGGRDAFLSDFFVVPAHRGKGVGSAAFALLESEARDRGLRALHLAVRNEDSRAMHLYEKAGYKRWPRTTLSKLFD
jgi:GNAT superfamily N-acetyltransferase